MLKLFTGVVFGADYTSHVQTNPAFPMRIGILLLLASYTLLWRVPAYGQCIAIETTPPPGIFCPGELITLTATPGYSSYQWYYNFSDSNSGGTLHATGSNTLTLEADWWAVTYWYVTTPDAACAEPSATVVWDSWVFLPPVIAHDANTTLCPGETALIEVPFSGPSNFQWYVNFAPIPGANGPTYVVAEPGFYTVSVSYPECPDHWLSSGVGPEFEWSPVVSPLIVLNTSGPQPVLTISYGNDIQWFFNGSPIPGANGLSHVPAENGTYWVQITDGNGCILTETFVLNTLSVAPKPGKATFTSVPNPFTESVALTVPSRGVLRLHDLAGRKVLERELGPGTHTLSQGVQPLKPGYYIAEFTPVEGPREVQKWLKER